MSITLRQLTYFRALAAHRHFGRAAAAVSVSQPALSVQIRDMEAALGQPLVERRARDVVLTPFGRLILGHADQVDSAMRNLEEAARWHGGLSGLLRIGLIPTLAPYMLPGTLEALRSGDISMDVQVQEAKTDRLTEDLLAGRLDAAVMALPVLTVGLIAEPLFEDRFLLAGSAVRLAAIGAGAETLRPDGLGAQQLLLLEDGHCLTDQALEACRRGRGHAQIDMGASSLATLTQLVAAGFGLTLMPEIAAAAEVRGASRVHLRRFDAPEPARTICLVRRSSTLGDGWFLQLAKILTGVGTGLTRAARSG
ncbi:hydrogen peroxide-inducible genes activator [Roseovarius sp. M141]|uniref:hydrogen peroxide-inducible genes activator n=1 Tax=Roseovarius sp. M141 TaxID=2583806 RepID=UPI0020CF2D43|nr:hydrogen peroxide-inducible genes activator [Roseovarius sp. M141]MCQ0093158.1 LysR family transcriptional regulator [Roseovarius sp. M141]